MNLHSLSWVKCHPFLYFPCNHLHSACARFLNFDLFLAAGVAPVSKLLKGTALQPIAAKSKSLVKLSKGDGSGSAPSSEVSLLSLAPASQPPTAGNQSPAKLSEAVEKGTAAPRTLTHTNNPSSRSTSPVRRPIFLPEIAQGERGWGGGHFASGRFQLCKITLHST